LYGLCKTELYSECLVADIDTFVQEVTANPRKLELFDLVKTLRLYQPAARMLTDPTYVQLVYEGQWQLCGGKQYARCWWVGTVVAGLNDEFAARYMFKPACKILSLAANISTGHQVQTTLVHLARVVMTGVPETFPWGTFRTDFNFFDMMLEPPVLPLFLLDLPSVQHYCQTTPTGPLALPNAMIDITNPPKIVTIHPLVMLSESGPKWLPPIVIGSINRLMFNGNAMILSQTDSGEDLSFEDVEEALIPVYAMLERPVIKATHNGPDWEFTTSSLASFGDTKIELYDFLRQSNRADDTQDPKHGGKRPSNMAHVQSLFEERLGGWKGKVFLKNKEDCPPCSACGFEGHWMDRESWMLNA